MFKQLYEAISGLESYDADAQLGQLIATITNDWEIYQAKHKVSDIAPDFGKDELPVSCYEALKDATVQEALAFATALGNAVQKERYAKTKDLKVSDLGIILL